MREKVLCEEESPAGCATKKLCCSGDCCGGSCRRNETDEIAKTKHRTERTKDSDGSWDQNAE